MLSPTGNSLGTANGWGQGRRSWRGGPHPGWATRGPSRPLCRMASLLLLLPVLLLLLLPLLLVLLPLLLLSPHSLLLLLCLALLM